MPTLEFLSDPLWQRLAWTLLHFVWQGTMLGLLLLTVLPLLRTASSRYLTALAVLLAMTVCPLVTFAVVEARGGDFEQSADLAHWVSMPSGASPEAELPLADPTVWEAVYHQAQPYIVLTWLAGVVLLGGRLLFSYLAVTRLRASGLRLPNPFEASFCGLARRMRISGGVLARQSHLVHEAMVVGLFRPLVLMPASWLSELPPQVIEAVLAHELAHIRRHDLWVNMLQRVVETLLFYHPAVWYVSRVLRVEREKCCDELAVAVTGQKVVYVEALELVARRRLAAPTVWAAAMGGTRKMNLLDRVRNVLGLRPESSAARYWPVGVAALVLPLGLWCATLVVSPAVTADEQETLVAQREGGEREGGEREGDRPRGEREGDRPAPREGERRDGDRPAPREGDRPMPPREGADRPGPREGGDRPFPPREGDRPFPPREGDRPFPPREGERPLGPVPPELMRLIAELRQEVIQLRREVNELREGRLPPRGEGRPEGRPEFREGDRPGPRGEFRPDARPEGRPEGRPEAREGDRPGPRPEARERPAAEREERERAERRAIEERREVERREVERREGERREGDAPRREGEPKKDGE